MTLYFYHWNKISTINLTSLTPRITKQVNPYLSGVVPSFPVHIYTLQQARSMKRKDSDFRAVIITDAFTIIKCGQRGTNDRITHLAMDATAY